MQARNTLATHLAWEQQSVYYILYDSDLLSTQNSIDGNFNLKSRFIKLSYEKTNLLVFFSAVNEQHFLSVRN